MGNLIELMQFKKFFNISILIVLTAFSLCTRLLHRNNYQIKNNNANNLESKSKTSLFNPENYKLGESEHMDDLMELRRAAMSRMKIRNPKNKFIKPQMLASNSTDPVPEEIYQSNYICNDGEYFDEKAGKCVGLDLNKTETMITAHPTRAKTILETSQNVTLAPCLNKTANKYDDKTVNLTFNPTIQKEVVPA